MLAIQRPPRRPVSVPRAVFHGTMWVYETVVRLQQVYTWPSRSMCTSPQTFRLHFVSRDIPVSPLW